MAGLTNTRRIGSRAIPIDGLATPQRYWSMLAIALGIVMAVLDSAVANIALPTIARQIHATSAASVWIVNAYQLASVVALLPLAALGERVGYRRVYLVGLAVFVAGSLGSALSGHLATLVAARILQGLGAAGIMAVNGALVRYTYPTVLLGRGVGLNALVVSIAAALGPTVASGILAVASWEWLFAINVPIGFVNLALAMRSLPFSERSQGRFDWASTGLNALTFGLLFIGIDTTTRGNGHLSLGCVELAAAAGAACVLFRRETASARPMIPLDLLRIRIFALSVATSVLSFAAYMLVFLSLPFFFESALHRNQVETGLLMTPWPVALGVAAPIAGRLADRMPAAILGSAGLGVLLCGLVLLATMPSSASAVDIIWRMALCGLGFGFFQAPNNRTLLSAAPRSRAGAAGGMLATARLIGMTVGATIATVTFRIAGASAEKIDLAVAALFVVVAITVSLLRLSAETPIKRAPPEPSVGL